VIERLEDRTKHPDIKHPAEGFLCRVLCRLFGLMGFFGQQDGGPENAAHATGSIFLR